MPQHLIARHENDGSYVPVDHPKAQVEAISGQMRKVTMRTLVPVTIQDPNSDEGVMGVEAHEATDYVPVEHVQQYAAEARTRWQEVIVGDEHDSGPGGDDQHLYADDHPAVVALNSADTPGA